VSVGVHIECDRCGRYVVWDRVSITKAKRLARSAGWSVGKATLCPKCKTTKTNKA